jgi:protein-tyrosine-phosphatase
MGMINGESMKAVLFVCSGNTCRSVMAAAMFASQAGPDWLVESAGLHAARGAPASSGAVRALAQQGIDLNRHRAKPIEDVALDQYGLVLVMTREQRAEICQRYRMLKGRVYLLAEMAGEAGEVRDPYEHPDEIYAETAAQIAAYLDNGRGKIERLAIVEK